MTEKDILEEFIPEEVRVKGEPRTHRHYQIAFADPASVLWRQHFPCDLMVDKKVSKDLSGSTQRKQSFSEV